MMYRFRNRMPQPGEGKSPRAQLDASRSADGIATLWIYDVIDSWGGFWGLSADEVRQALDDLGDVSEIHLHINTPGGDYFEAVAMSNLLANHKAKTVAIVDGLAASAGSLLTVTCDERVMGRGSEVMIHDASMIAYGNADAFRSAAETLDKVSGDLASTYATFAGGDTETWRTAMRATTWYTAEEAVAAGLADRVGTVAAADPVEEVTEGDLDNEPLVAAFTGQFTLSAADSRRAATALQRPRRTTVKSHGPDVAGEYAARAAAKAHDYKASQHH